MEDSPILTLTNVPLNWNDVVVQDGNITFNVYAETLYACLGEEGTLDFVVWLNKVRSNRRSTIAQEEMS